MKRTLKRWKNSITKRIFSKSLISQNYANVITQEVVCKETQEVVNKESQEVINLEIKNFLSGLKDLGLGNHPISKQIQKLQPVAITSEFFDPRTTGVLCLRNDLKHAVIHAASHTINSKIMPCFILIDDFRDKQPNLPTNEELTKEFDVQTYSYSEIETLPLHNIFLYGSTYDNLAFFLVYHTLCKNILPLHKVGLPFKYIFDKESVACGTPTIITPSFYLDKIDDIITCYDSFVDEESREIFLRCIITRLTSEIGFLYLPGHPTHEHPKLIVGQGDFVCDGGAWDGDTATKFAENVGSSGHVYAFEPVKNTFDLLVNNTVSFENITVENYGLYSEKSSFFINLAESGSSVTREHAENTEECKVIDLDTYFADKKCSVIKLDIEGSELECLKGAYNTIKRDKPKLMISLYHKPQDLFELTLWVIQNFPEYKLYCSHHSYAFQETMLYAIASENE